MSKSKWRNAGEFIEKYPCVNLGLEKCISGEKGEIWESGPGRYKAFLALRSGDEKIISFDSKYLPKAVIRIDVPASRRRQVALANDPNLRHK